MFKGETISRINKWIIDGECECEIVTGDKFQSVSEKLAYMIAKHEGFTVRVIYA